MEIMGRKLVSFHSRISFIWILFLLPGLVSVSDSKTPVQLENHPFHSRLRVKIHQGIDVEWKPLSGGFQILFKGLSLSDLGAPFGQEQQWVEPFNQLKDERLSMLRVLNSQKGVKIIGKWKFKKGPKAPAYPKMNTFHFTDQEKQEFVLDFWVRKGPTWGQVLQKEAEKKRKKAFEAIEQRLQKRVQRRKASIERNNQIADTDKFCRQKLDEQSDVFIPFKSAHQRVDYSKIYPLTMPDSDYPYFQPDGGGKEGEYIRLALSLYRRGKYALAIRTIKFFYRDIKNSNNLLQMKFLHANTLMKLGHLKGLVKHLEKIINRARVFYLK